MCQNPLVTWSTMNIINSSSITVAGTVEEAAAVGVAVVVVV